MPKFTTGKLDFCASTRVETGIKFINVTLDGKKLSFAQDFTLWTVKQLRSHLPAMRLNYDIFYQSKGSGRDVRCGDTVTLTDGEDYYSVPN